MDSLLAALWGPAAAPGDTVLRRQLGGGHGQASYVGVLIPSCPPTELAAVDLTLLACALTMMHA